MNQEHVALFWVVAGAALAPYLARRLRLPSAALEILYGLWLFHGPIPHVPSWLPLLEELGLLYLLFLGGLELDLRLLTRSPRLRWYVLVPALSLMGSPLAFASMGLAPYHGLCVAVVSAGMVMPALREEGATRTPFGRDALGLALVGEVLAILALTGVDTWRIHGISLEAVFVLGKLSVLLALAAAALKAIHLFGWWNPGWVGRVMASDDPSEEGVRGAIALVFAGVLLAEAAGIEPLLGSFMAGLITTAVFRNRALFEHKLSAVGYGFFTPFFFIGIGAGAELRWFTDPTVVGTAAVLTLGVLASKLPVVLAARPLGLDLGQVGRLSLLLSAPLSMMVVAGALGRRLGFLTPVQDGAVVLAALVSSVLYPVAFRLFRGEARSSPP